MNYATIASLGQQQRNLKAHRPPNEAKRKNKVKLVQLSNVIDRRYTRTPSARALVNRIYLRFEIYKSNHDDYAYLQVNNHLIKRIRARAYRRLHNLLLYDEPFAIKLIESYAKDPVDPIANGVHFDEAGCPIYGRRFNSMFNESDNLQIWRANFHRLLDAKIHDPTVFFDFRPANVVGYANISPILANLNDLVLLNLRSKRPFSFTFLNYQPAWNSGLEPIMSIKPNFIGIHPSRSSTAFTYKDRKLLILMGTTQKRLKPLSSFDHEANYLIPLYTNDRSMNISIQEHYISEYEGKANVELIYVPIEGVVKEQFPFDFSFYYYTLQALKDGRSLRASINYGYYFMVDGLQAQNKIGPKKPNSGNCRFRHHSKKFPFRHFDNLEDELL